MQENHLHHLQSYQQQDFIIGLVGIRDDVRPEAREAIAEVQNAGIQVVMITGDRLETAIAIAKDAGLLQKEEDIALTSAQLNEMSDEEIKNMISKIRVIARALPTDKSRMVHLCQEMNRCPSEGLPHLLPCMNSSTFAPPYNCNILVSLTFQCN